LREIHARSKRPFSQKIASAITLDYLGLPWITLDYLGLPWITLDYLGLPWITLDSVVSVAPISAFSFQLSGFSSQPSAPLSITAPSAKFQRTGPFLGPSSRPP
jgi:hypothetical protein